jgi:hypothetical protein
MAMCRWSGSPVRFGIEPRNSTLDRRSDDRPSPHPHGRRTSTTADATLRVRPAQCGKIAEMKRRRSPPLLVQRRGLRSFTRRTATGPIPVRTRCHGTFQVRKGGHPPTPTRSGLQSAGSMQHAPSACRQLRWRNSGAHAKTTAAKRDGRQSMAASLGGDVPAYPPRPAPPPTTAVPFG